MSDAPSKTAAANEPVAKEPVAKTLPLDQITTANRLRPLDEDYVRFLAGSMAEKGLMAAILVRPTPNGAAPYTLIAGSHRYAAAQLLGWPDIPTIIHHMSAERARLMEIDENLIRHDLTKLDRCLFLAERKRAYEELYPQTRHGGDRRSEKVQDVDIHAGFQVAKIGHLPPDPENRSAVGESDQNDNSAVLAGEQGQASVNNEEFQVLNFADLKSHDALAGSSAVIKFTEDAANKLGVSRQTVERAVAIARKLDPEAIAHLRKTRSVNNAAHLAALSRQPADAQRKAAQIIAEDGDIDMNVAIRMAKGQRLKPVVDDGGFLKILTAYGHATKRAQRAFIEHLKEKGVV